MILKVLLVINIIPPEKNMDSSPFLLEKGELSMIAAHRGGSASNPELLFIVEIKNDGEMGREACRILNETLQQYPGYLDQIVVGTFRDEVEEELRTSYPNLFRGSP